MSAAGACHHPTILLKGKTLQGRWLTHKIQGASYGNTERGWTTDEEAITWVKKFIRDTQPYEILSSFGTLLISNLDLILMNGDSF